MRNEKNDLVGIQKSKSGSINLKILAQTIEEVRFINQIDGELYPDSKFPKGARRLRGFDWRGDEQLMSVEDLFTNDPPLELPVINGLKDYIPPEEFIDDSLNERIEKAGNNTPNKPNKAAQNLPNKDAVFPFPESVKKPKTNKEKSGQ